MANVPRTLAWLAAFLPCIVSCSSIDESAQLTIAGTVVDSQEVPIAEKTGNVCVDGLYSEVGGTGYDLTSCARMATDLSGKFVTKLILGPRLRDVKSSTLALEPGSCPVMGTFSSPVQIRDGANGLREVSISVRYVASQTGCP